MRRKPAAEQPSQRTDIIRERRGSRAQQTRNKLSRQSQPHDSLSPPPVMTRHAALSGATRPLRRAKRRYDISLNAPGAEMSLPSLPIIYPGWRLVSFALVVLLAVVLYQFWNSAQYRVDAVDVIGLQRMTAGDINAVLGVTGKPIFTLDAAAMQQQLNNAFPEFAAVAVDIELPHTVAITVTERLPVLVWSQGGKLELVDADGVAFELRQGGSAAGYPVIEALGDPPALPQPLDEPAAQRIELDGVLNYLTPGSEVIPGLTVLSSARPFLSPGMVSAILLMAKQSPDDAPLIYEPQHGLGWRDKRGWSAYFGDVQEVPMKLYVYRAIVQRLKAEDTRPVLISVENVHAPYYRLEP